jgi:hypothetical protein
MVIVFAAGLIPTARGRHQRRKKAAEVVKRRAEANLIPTTIFKN